MTIKCKFTAQKYLTFLLWALKKSHVGQRRDPLQVWKNLLANCLWKPLTCALGSIQRTEGQSHFQVVMQQRNRPRAPPWQWRVAAPGRMGAPIWCHRLSASISSTRATKAWPHSQGDRHPPVWFMLFCGVPSGSGSQDLLGMSGCS